MIEIKTIGIWGFEGAIRGMRMPYESFDKNDSFKCETGLKGGCIGCGQQLIDDRCISGEFVIGKSDMTLAKKLIAGGSEHRKFMRMIHVQAEVRAPRYWWAEMDKYKWVEANSSSTMHLITKRELTLDDFSIDYGQTNNLPYELMLNQIENVKYAVKDYQRDKERGCSKEILESDFRIIKQLLPESFMQRRMIDTDYECLLNIYHQRKNHRLSEWHDFCSWIESLLYMKEFLCV